MTTDRIAQGETVCPLCGAEMRFRFDNDGDEGYSEWESWIECESCGYSIHFKTKEIGIPLWGKLHSTLRRAATLTAENEQLSAQLAEERKRREGLATLPSDVEKLAANFHLVYQEELKQQGKQSKYSDDYNSLPEDIKDLDRALAKYVIGFLHEWYGDDET